MKKIIKALVGLSLVTLLAIVVLNNVSTIKADSGWDTDYDSGSSSSSFGTEYSSSHHNSSSNNLSSIEGAFVFFAIVIGVFIFFIVKVIRENKLKSSLESDNENDSYKLKEEDAIQVIPYFNIEEFNTQAYQIFYDVQMAWMNFEYDKLKELLTDELYNSYVMQLEALKIKGQKNVMKEFVLNESSIFELKEENGHYIAKVDLDVEFYDYVENIKNKKIVRGKSNIKVNNFYTLTFICTKEKSNNINKCPNCGAKVEGNTTGTCKYCKSKLINKNYNWVMSEKEIIIQINKKQKKKSKI